MPLKFLAMALTDLDLQALKTQCELKQGYSFCQILSIFLLDLPFELDAGISE